MNKGNEKPTLLLFEVAIFVLLLTEVHYISNLTEKKLRLKSIFNKFTGVEILWKHAETVCFQKISTPKNYMKLRYFVQ